MYTVLMTSRTAVIVIVSSSGLPFLFLNCPKSTFRNPVHLVWVVLSINIKHNHILTRPDRAEFYDGCLRRKDGHMCHSSPIMRLFWRTHKNRSKLDSTRWSGFTICVRQKAEVCLRLFTLKGFKATCRCETFTSFLAYYSCVQRSTFLHFSLSPSGAIN